MQSPDVTAAPASSAPPSYAIARQLMVDGQVRPNRVTDPRLIAALRELPRERFLPPSAAVLAYADEDVPLGVGQGRVGQGGSGRVMLAPMTLARLVQAMLDRSEGGHALVLGAGTGYGAAVLARCGFSVTAAEDDPALCARARLALAEVGASVTAVEAGPANPPQGPFEAILIEGGFEVLPDTIAARLAPRGGAAGGRLYGIRRSGFGVGQAVIGELTPAGLALVPLFDAFTACLPGLAAPPSFVF